jgi:triacylglycerol lipase
VAYPIILAHGVCRFDKFWSDMLQIDNNEDARIDRLHYFRGIRTMLKENGFVVYHASVSWAADVDKRAKDLKRVVLSVIQKEACKRVNIIAHSMGGLDTRHMLYNEREQDRIHEMVASVTTISTPHNGSSFADWGTENLPYVIPAARKLGLDMTAIYDLRTDRCRAFNEDPRVQAFEKQYEKAILLQTYAGKQDFWSIFDVLKLSSYIIEKNEGENDGLVSVESAKWREKYFRGKWDHTDHLNELGWWDPAQMFCGESEDQLLARIHGCYLDIARGLP